MGVHVYERSVAATQTTIKKSTASKKHKSPKTTTLSKKRFLHPDLDMNDILSNEKDPHDVREILRKDVMTLNTNYDGDDDKNNRQKTTTAPEYDNENQQIQILSNTIYYQMISQKLSTLHSFSKREAKKQQQQQTEQRIFKYHVAIHDKQIYVIIWGTATNCVPMYHFGKANHLNCPENYVVHQNKLDKMRLQRHLSTKHHLNVIVQTLEHPELRILRCVKTYSTHSCKDCGQRYAKDKKERRDRPRKLHTKYCIQRNEMGKRLKHLSNNLRNKDAHAILRAKISRVYDMETFDNLYKHIK